MLRAVKNVRDEITRRCAEGRRTLQVVSDVFEALTILDEVIYVAYDTPSDNPVWGRFSRWSRSPGVYAPASTVVEVAYAGHLSEPWRRFVVCKELCHALDTSNGKGLSHASMDNLVTAFVIRSTSGDLSPVMAAYAPELLAEVGALEILFPLPNRNAVLLEMPIPDQATKQGIAERYGIPLPYVDLGLQAEFNEAVQVLLEDG